MDMHQIFCVPDVKNSLTLSVILSLYCYEIGFRLGVCYTSCLTSHCKTNHIFFFQMFWKDGPPTKIALEYDLSCIIRKDEIFFLQKFSLDGKWKIMFLQEIPANMIYFVYAVFLFPTNIILPFYRKEKMIFSRKCT